MKDYLNLFNPRGTYPLFLYRRNEKGQLIPGKDRGPDGKQLLRVDGPHAAPAQAYVGYSTVMLVGAGIGLTPSAAILRATLMYRWKRGLSPKHICFAWVVRQTEVNSFQVSESADMPLAAR